MPSHKMCAWPLLPVCYAHTPHQLLQIVTSRQLQQGALIKRMNVSVCVSAQLDLISGGTLRLWVPLLAVVATAVCDGFAQGSLYAEAAAYPAIYTQVVCLSTHGLPACE